MSEKIEFILNGAKYRLDFEFDLEKQEEFDPNKKYQKPINVTTKLTKNNVLQFKYFDGLRINHTGADATRDLENAFTVYSEYERVFADILTDLINKKEVDWRHILVLFNCAEKRPDGKYYILVKGRIQIPQYKLDITFPLPVIQ